ncbi:MAG TPA: hypothetical protein ENI93_03085 [Gammaproteobacteria bacterium]|nr:hypothetical protein [Gammaproteobacteria bacterium]
MARTLEKNQWETYLDNVAKHLGAELVEIEVAGINLGDQIETEWVPLIGISYDPKDDVVSVAVEGAEHLIRKPAEIVVEDNVDGLHWIDIKDGDGNQHIVRLKTPLALPAG